MRDSYYFMAHFSRYIPRGSKVLSLDKGVTDTNSTFMATAAKTPSGEIVVVVLNTDDKEEVKYQLELRGKFAELTLPPSSIHTLRTGN